MNEREFYIAVQKQIIYFMPSEYEGAKARIDDVTKPGDAKLHGLSIHKDESGAYPLLYLDDYYKLVGEGWPIERILTFIAADYDRLCKRFPDLKIPDLTYDKIKNDLRIKLVYINGNKELLKNLYSADVGCGYALTVFADMSDEFAENAVVNIRKDMIEKYGYDEAQLLQDAVMGSIRNSPAKLSHIEDEIFYDDPENLFYKDKYNNKGGILVLTTSDKLFGAAALFYPGIKERIGELVQGSYFVLPSSIHELLICPDDGMRTAQDLAEMVSFVNSTEVTKDEQLGNRVLYYDALTRNLEVAIDKDLMINETERER